VFNGNGLQIQAVKPETVDAFEVGLKGSPSRVLTFDAASYFYKYRNLQVSSFGTTAVSPTLRNAAKAEIYGFEANATVAPAKGLSLRGGVAYTHGEYTEFERAQGFRPTTNAAGVPVGGNTSYIIADASGNRLVRTPRLQLNSTIAYETEIAMGGELLFNLTGSHTSSMNQDIEGNVRQPGFTVFNANVAYTTADERWRASLFGNNIFDEKYIAGILVSSIATSVTYAKPATYGVKLEYFF
jgi:iron complex outermembrane receptor protein